MKRLRSCSKRQRSPRSASPSDRIRDSLATVAGGRSSGTVQTSTPGASMSSVTAEMSLDQAGEQVQLLDVAGPLHELHTTGVPGELVQQGMVQAGAGAEAAERFECRLLREARGACLRRRRQGTGGRIVVVHGGRRPPDELPELRQAQAQPVQPLTFGRVQGAPVV